MKNTHIIAGLSLLNSLSTQAAVLIDLNPSAPGIQTSITDATEGQVIEIALVVTGFTDFNPCMNGIGGDISSRGSMTVAFGAPVFAGDIASFTNEGYSRIPIGAGSPTQHINPGQTISTAGLAPLPGYTQNLGGAGFMDPGNNVDGNGELYSFTATPGSASSYATIFTTSITVSNINSTTLELFPSGIFDNPPTTDMGGQVALDQVSGSMFYPTQFVQEGSLSLHTQTHDFQSCVGGGLGALQGASITGVPEPSSAMLAGAFSWLLLMRRKRA